MPCEYDQMRVTNNWWEVGYLQSVEELPGLSEINPSSDRVEDLNPGPPEYKSSPTTGPRSPPFSECPDFSCSRFEGCLEPVTNRFLSRSKRVAPS